MIDAYQFPLALFDITEFSARPILGVALGKPCLPEFGNARVEMKLDLLRNLMPDVT